MWLNDSQNKNTPILGIKIWHFDVAIGFPNKRLNVVLELRLWKT